MKLKKLISILTASIITLNVTCSNPPLQVAHAEEAATIGYSAEWVKIGDAYTISNVYDEAISSDQCEPFFIDISSVTDWSKNYIISADVKVSKGEQSAAFCYETTTSWWEQSGETITTEKQTVYFATQQQTLNWLKFIPWQIEPGVTVTVENVKIEESPSWIFDADKLTWTITNNTSVDLTSDDYSPAYLNGWDVSDWSKIEYISVDAETNLDNSNSDHRTVYGALAIATPTSAWMDSGTEDITPVKNYIAIETKGEEIYSPRFIPWNLPAGITLTISNPIFHTAERSIEFTAGKWVQLENGTWYFNQFMIPDYYPETAEPDKIIKLTPPEGLEWSDIESLSFDMRSPTGSNVEVIGKYDDGSVFKRNIFARKSNEMDGNTINLKRLVSDIYIKTGAMAKNDSIYLNNIEFGTEPIADAPIEPNDVLIDDVAMEYKQWDAKSTIMPSQLAKIQTTGTLKIYVEKLPLPDDHSNKLEFVLNDWTENGNGWEIYTPGFVVTDTIIEVEVTEELLKRFETAEFIIHGEYVKYLKTVFTPDVDTEKPESEEFIPDEKEKNELDKEIENNKSIIKMEYEGPRRANEMELNKIYVQKSGEKDRNGKKVHALRFIQKVKKSDVENAKSFSLVLSYDGKYVEVSSTNYFTSVNIDGFEIPADNNNVYIIIIVDNIPIDKEIKFSNYKINK